MSWTAVVPMKQGGAQKSRLSGVLTFEQRATLTQSIAAYVLEALAAAPEISLIIVLSPAALADPRFDWTELLTAKLLVIHGDLPLLQDADISALLQAAEASGIAIAPDRHGEGTNSLALATAEPFVFQFGEDSCARHVAANPSAAIVRRTGLSHDIDTPEDLNVAIALGFHAPY
jgi:2-phospho-L-lactate/phosphoenolpyruvate guanylyltransferase